MPDNIEEYVEKIGRADKPSNQAIVTSFFDPREDHLLVEPLIKTLELVMNYNKIYTYCFLIQVVFIIYNF